MSKIILLIPVLVLLPFAMQAQRALTGVWTGKVSNDSTTIRRDQGFELALTQYKEKVYGYSRTSFIVNDTLFYVLKRVKGTIDGDKCEIRDDEIVSYNFPGRIDKGIKVTTTFRLNKEDSTWRLDGNWSTNKTKRYYAITGKVEMKEETDPSKSKIYAHLEELNLDKEVAAIAQDAKPVAPKVIVTHVPKATAPVVKPTVKPTEQPADKPIVKPAEKPIVKPAEKPVVRPVEKPIIKPVDKPKEQPAIVPVPKSATVPAGPVPPAADINDRKTIVSQTVVFHSDTLQLSLYDNGEVDGDTVSVLLDDELILSKEMLKATAIRKTVITAGKSDFMLLFYAENLGKYPPNTGLIVVRDGDDVYQVRFSADLKTNSAIIFKRKEP